MFLSWVRTLTTGQHISWQSAKKYCCSKSIWRKVGKATAPRQNKGMISRVRLLIHARITAKIVSSQDARVRYVAMALEKKTGSEKDSFFVFHCPFLEFQFWVLQLYRDRRNSSMWLICWKNQRGMPTVWSFVKCLFSKIRRESQQHHLISQDPLNYRCLPCSRMTIEEFFASMSPGWNHPDMRCNVFTKTHQCLGIIYHWLVEGKTGNHNSSCSHSWTLVPFNRNKKYTHTQSKASDPCFWGLVFFHPFFSCPQVDGPQATPTHLSRQEICITWHMSCGFDMFCSEN